MSQAYSEKLSNMAKKAQESFQAIAELNVKTLQGLAYMKPEEFSQIKKPEELLERQMELVLENGHKALDYMQKSFQIVEKSLRSMTDETKRKGE